MTASDRRQAFLISLAPKTRELHDQLLKKSGDYATLFELLSLDGGLESELRRLITTAAVHGARADTMLQLVDLETATERDRYFATKPGVYLDVQIKPPAELEKFMGGADARLMNDAELGRIERSVIDWLNKRYSPPAHLGFRIEFSEVLADAGKQSPLEIWLARRDLCP